jgi:hypothetical protein
VRTSGRCLLAALALSAALTACGSSSGSGQDTAVAQVKQTLTRAFHALATGDGATLCSLATAQGRKTLAAALPKSSCASIIKLVTAHLSPSQKAALASVQIKRVTLNGGQASVSDRDITSAHGSLRGFIQPQSAPTVLSKQPDGSWKISG